MKTRGKAAERFKAKPEELKVTFRPQCVKCTKNINLTTCDEFDPKPAEYMTNETDCPVINKR